MKPRDNTDEQSFTSSDVIEVLSTETPLRMKPAGSGCIGLNSSRSECIESSPTKASSMGSSPTTAENEKSSGTGVHSSRPLKIGFPQARIEMSCIAPNARLFVNVRIGKINMQSLCDTGCSDTTASSKYWDIFMEEGFRVVPASGSVALADKSSAEITGIVFLTLEIGTRKLKQKVYLVKGLSHPFILGINTLNLLKAKMNFEDRTLILPPQHPQTEVEIIKLETLQGIQLCTLAIQEADGEDYSPEIPEEDFSSENFVHPDMSDQQTQWAAEFLNEWKEKFKTSSGRTNAGILRLYYDRSLPPVKVRQHKFSPPMLELANKEVERLLKEGVIRESDSPFNSPCFIYHNKKKNKTRLIVDYRELNKRLRKDSSPVVNPLQSLAEMKDARVISTIDLREAFYSLPVHPDSQEATGFSVGLRKFEFMKSPLGLSTTPSVWSATIEKILRPFLGKFCFIFIDDALIFSKDVETHFEHLDLIFKALRTNELLVNFGKSSFFRQRVRYLGTIVGNGTMEADPEKVTAIRNLAQPRTVTQLRSFLGAVNFLRPYVKNLAEMAIPLQEMLKKGQKIEWTEDRCRAFTEIKDALSSTVVLSMANFDYGFEVRSDASDRAIGGALTQSINGEIKIIAFCSRALSKSERNYSTTQRECLSVIFCLERWKEYLLGDPRTKVFVDHHSLIWISRLSDPVGLLQRWLLRISMFDFKVIYTPGKENALPDLMSRNPYEVEPENVESSTEEEFNIPRCAAIDKGETEQVDSWYNSLKSKVLAEPTAYPAFVVNKEGVLFKKVKDLSSQKTEWRRVVPAHEREAILEACHDRSAHLGVSKTTALISQCAYWPRIKEDVKIHVRRCAVCQKNKPSNLPPVGLMKTREQSTVPWEVANCDLIGPLPLSNGKKYIFAIIDQATKYCYIRGIRAATSKACVKVLEREVFPAHGACKLLISDGGSCFSGAEFEKFCKVNGIQHNITPPYRPQCNGAVERLNQTIKNALRAYVSENHKTWDNHLFIIERALRSCPHDTTGYSPNMLLYGHEVRPIYDPDPDLHNGNSMPFVADDYLKEKRKEIETLYKKAVDNVIKAKARQSHTYNLRRKPSQYVIGSLVWKKNFPQSSKINDVTAKLLPKWIGPFRVTKLYSESQVHLEDLKGKDVGRWHVDLLRPAFL